MNERKRAAIVGAIAVAEAVLAEAWERHQKGEPPLVPDECHRLRVTLKRLKAQQAEAV